MPAAQLKQEEEPAVDQVPTPHEMQEAELRAPFTDENVPEAHAVHEGAPNIEDHDPVLQETHAALDVAAKVVEYVPRAHNEHDVELALLHVPALHCGQRIMVMLLAPATK